MDVNATMERFLEQCVAEGRERGLQLAVYHDGGLVVDACAGVADPATGRRVDGDTLFPVFSCTKALAATLLHQLVEGGQLTYDTPMAEVWPEFAACGKSATTVRHALCHASGLPGMPVGIGYRDLADWHRMCRSIAALEPEWPAGSKMMYHAVTFSWTVGEIICRVTGKPFPQALAEQIARPLGIEDSMYVGIPDSAEPRVAILDEIFAAPPVPPDDSVRQAIPGWMQPLHTMMNRPDARRACIPASNGIMSARALARHYAALLPGGVDGVELLPPARVRAATTLQRPDGYCEGDPVWNMSLGYFIGGEGSDMGPASVFGHGGYGGSIAFADPERQLAVALTKNLFSPQSAVGDILRELRAALSLRQTA